MYGPVRGLFDYIITIGASAGGVQAIGELLSYLPANLPAPICIAQHLSSSQPSHLREVLQRRTKLRVRWGENGVMMAPGEVYLTPPRSQMRIELNRELVVSYMLAGERPRTSADALFQSAAASLGPQVIGIVLTGCLRDGAKGVQAIRECGGRVFVQSPEACEWADMPIASMRTGAVDLSLPIRGLAAAVAAITLVPGASGVFEVGSSYRRALADKALQTPMWRSRRVRLSS